jgi:hypothetical protein
MAAALAWQVTTAHKRASSSPTASVTLDPTALGEQASLLQEMRSLAQSALRVATARWALDVLRTVLQEPTTAKPEGDLDMTVLPAVLESTVQEQPTQSLTASARQDTTALPDRRLRTRRRPSQATIQRLVLPLLHLAQLAPMAHARLRRLAWLALLGFTALM